MGEIVNLRRVQKRRERAAAMQAASESRVRHGRTDAQKQNDQRTQQRRRGEADGQALREAAAPTLPSTEPAGEL